VIAVDDEQHEFTVFSGVYPPSEDTYLLLDTIEFKPDDVFLEVGCGAGFITLNAAGRARSVMGIDSSLEAVRNTLENLRRNDLCKNCHVIESDLLGALAPTVKFSLIVFNPPYLPQDDEHTGLDHALVGGESGTELTLRFVRQAVMHLASKGRVFLVTSSLSDIDSIRETMTECGLSVDVVSERSLFFEKIQVLRGIL
jgi:release factor glutamine methyltransferase